ncbi:hypothetical protein Zmor_017723 [Zophobas morio]|uniref:Uncharacterized protein n=1 Tax=Zophobas morio TaxID=2755281 RepID=A0AA38I5Q4_9CUCU|nr:hypothetical protein Zmor_017723 [Zophobas morio]
MLKKWRDLDQYPTSISRHGFKFRPIHQGTVMTQIGGFEQLLNLGQYVNAQLTHQRQIIGSRIDEITTAYFRALAKGFESKQIFASEAVSRRRLRKLLKWGKMHRHRTFRIQA